MTSNANSSKSPSPSTPSTSLRRARIHPSRSPEHAAPLVGRRPLAAARAVIFSQMVDDPSGRSSSCSATPPRASGHPRARQGQRRARLEQASGRIWAGARRGAAGGALTPGRSPLDECAADIERERLFEIIRQLVLSENPTSRPCSSRARDGIWRSRWRYALRENADRSARPASCSTATSCPRSTIPLPAAARCRWRGATAGPGSLRQRPERGGGADQQGDDRDPAEVRGPATREPSVVAEGEDRWFPRSGAGRWGWPRMFAITASGCATRRRSELATLRVRRSRSRGRWCRSGRTKTI